VQLYFCIRDVFLTTFLSVGFVTEKRLGTGEILKFRGITRKKEGKRS